MPIKNITLGRFPGDSNRAICLPNNLEIAEKVRSFAVSYGPTRVRGCIGKHGVRLTFSDASVKEAFLKFVGFMPCRKGKTEGFLPYVLGKIKSGSLLERYGANLE